MKVYLAGSITGDPNYKEKFCRAEERLKKDEFVVLNPAVLPEGMAPKDYMMLCVQMIFAVDIVAFLPDWKESRGATLEHALCEYIGRTHFDLTEDDL